MQQPDFSQLIQMLAAGKNPGLQGRPMQPVQQAPAYAPDALAIAQGMAGHGGYGPRPMPGMMPQQIQQALGSFHESPLPTLFAPQIQGAVSTLQGPGGPALQSAAGQLAAPGKPRAPMPKGGKRRVSPGVYR